MRYAIAAACIGLAGCATPPRIDLSPYVGTPVDTLIARIGVPDGERVIAGRHIMSWRNNRIIGIDGDVATLQCRIDVRVGVADTILGYQWQGNYGGCAPYMQALGE